MSRSRPARRGFVRRAWHRSRHLPGLRALTALGDPVLWTLAIARSGAVDAEFVAAQIGRRRMSELSAAAVYAFGGFRRGVSIRHDVHEAYAARRLPGEGNVPAYYSYLRNRATSDAALRDPLTPLVAREAAIAAARSAAAGLAEWGHPAADSADAVTAVVVVMAGDPRIGHRLRIAAAVADHVVVAAVGVHMGDWLAIGGAARDGAVSAIGFPAGIGPREAVRQVLPSRGRVLVIDPMVDVRVDELSAVAAAARPGVVIAPIEQASDDTVRAAGAVVVGERRFNLFEGLPIEDVRRIGEAFAVPHAAGLTFAAIAPLGGAEPVFVDPAVRVRVDPSAPPEAEIAECAPVSGDDRTIAEQLYRRAGFEVADWAGESPRLTRLTTSPRWAIKIASLAGEAGDVWGDTHFGEALADALRRVGNDAVVDRREAALRCTAYLDDVHLIVRGPTRLHPPAHGVRILWIISHPHEISAEELDEFDIVFAASTRWAAEATERFGRLIRPLLECTDAERYRPRGRPRSHDILFVGKSRDVPRRVVIAPVEAGVPVRVYGPDWSAYIPDECVVAPFVPLSALPEMYETAAVVLNDQWPEMRDAGFPAMRPFDVVASGGRVISEYVDGIEEALGPGVVTYRDERELVALLKENDFDRLFPSDAVLRENAERVRREHSFSARAGVLLEAVRRHTSMK